MKATDEIDEPQVRSAPDAGPQLLCEFEPRWRSFRGSLREMFIPSGDRAIRRRGLDALATGDWFWHDVFVRRPLAKRALVDSYLVHVLVVLAVVGLTRAGWFTPRSVQWKDPFDNTHIEYYNVSEYLPELDTDEPAPKTAPEQRKPRTDVAPVPADPVYAKQEIISVPPNPDNLNQTIVTPQLPKVERQVDLPNIVSHMPTLAPQPIIVPKSVVKAKVGDAQAPKIDAKSSTLKLDTRAQLPQLQPQVNASTTNATLADSLPVPALPVNESPKLEVLTVAPSQRRAANGQAAADETAVAMPQVSGDSAAQIIALSKRPVDPRGALDVPKGNRLGSFEAGPTGRVGASGTPAAASSSGSPGGNGKSGLPPGIKVGPAPGAAPPSGTVVAAPSAGRPPAPDPSMRARLLAAMQDSMATPSRIAPPQTNDDKVEDPYFGARRYFTMTFNAPNLNSAVGSWVIHFAELKPMPGENGALSGPAPLSKVDPAYPPDLVRDGIEGTVVLYAVVNVDGSVSNVKVLNSVNERLDANAEKALMRWRFQPGTKNGKPVGVEMTVRIPFRAKRLMF
jgi:protein TonB